MLQALIRTKNNDFGTKNIGDVICVKLKEHAFWGGEELKYHQALNWFDDELENRMRSSEDSPIGGFIVSITPYQEKQNVDLYDEENSLLGNFDVCKTRSRKYFNINNLNDDELISRIIDDNIVVHPDEIEDEKVLSCISDKSEIEIEQEFDMNKSQVIQNIVSNR